MMGALHNHRDKEVTVSVEALVPVDHFLRAVEATIDFSFIEEKLQPYYCEDNGRPSIHPITLFKMMFVGYFYGIRSERQLAKEIETNIAYRWFLGLSLSDKVPIIQPLVLTDVLDSSIPRFSKKFLMRLSIKPLVTEWSAVEF